MPPIVIIGRFRYSNASIMGVGHDWAEENSDLTQVKGLIKVDTFHISPDRGMAIYYLKTTEQAKAALQCWKNSLLVTAKCSIAKLHGKWERSTKP